MHLVWLRTDLRLADNPALFYACEQAKSTQQPLSVVYCSTPDQWQLHCDAPSKFGLHQQALQDLQPRLNKLGITLHVLSGSDYSSCVDLLKTFVSKHNIQHIWWNTETPLYEQQRDSTVSEAMQQLGVGVNTYEADFLVPTYQLKTQQGGFYKVFTPWYKRWKDCLENTRDLLPEPDAIGKSVTQKDQPTLPYAEQYRDDLWPGTEQAANKALQKFCDNRLTDYINKRDTPSVNGTSTLSPYFACGLISARQCLHAVQQQTREWRGNHWIREVAWREFYRYLLLCFPDLNKHRPFKPETTALQWEDDAKLREAWQQGKTGFPIVDAAQRQLLQTGWMHNRLRMISASFFTKLMLEHWRYGEDFFMQHLLDGDFASNNGGWQWSASTGCDASPWFRVFNPTTQSEKFDAQGDFIRRFVPELADLKGKSIHNPPAKVREQLGYPQPIIDYKAARERVLARFKQLNSD